MHYTFLQYMTSTVDDRKYTIILLNLEKIPFGTICTSLATNKNVTGNNTVVRNTVNWSIYLFYPSEAGHQVTYDFVR